MTKKKNLERKQKKGKKKNEIREKHAKAGGEIRKSRKNKQ